MLLYLEYVNSRPITNRAHCHGRRRFANACMMSIKDPSTICGQMGLKLILFLIQAVEKVFDLGQKITLKSGFDALSGRN